MKEFKEYKKDKDASNKALNEALRNIISAKTIRISDLDNQEVGIAIDSSDKENHAKIKWFLERLVIPDESEAELPSFNEFRGNAGDGSISYLTEAENREVDEWIRVLENEHDGVIDESWVGKVLGGATGFVIGPTIGKVIAKALGIEKGVLYDMFTSRLVSTALGAAIAKEFGNK